MVFPAISVVTNVLGETDSKGYCLVLEYGSAEGE